MCRTSAIETASPKTHDISLWQMYAKLWETQRHLTSFADCGLKTAGSNLWRTFVSTLTIPSDWPPVIECSRGLPELWLLPGNTAERNPWSTCWTITSDCGASLWLRLKSKNTWCFVPGTLLVTETWMNKDPFVHSDPLQPYGSSSEKNSYSPFQCLLVEVFWNSHNVKFTLFRTAIHIW